VDIESVKEWVSGVLNMAASGAAHEIERDEELESLADGIVAAEVGERGDFVVEDTDGNRYRVTIQLLDPDTGDPTGDPC
jgi:hypothetical protein